MSEILKHCNLPTNQEDQLKQAADAVEIFKLSWKERLAYYVYDFGIIGGNVAFSYLFVSYVLEGRGILAGFTLTAFASNFIAGRFLIDPINERKEEYREAKQRYKKLVEKYGQKE